MPCSAATIAQAPKVLLHDHLDGGLRPQTVIDLAESAGYRKLPSQDAVDLARWFSEAAYSGSLERYLETFQHTGRSHPEAPRLSLGFLVNARRTLAADGVVYAEVRFAPELHVEQGLSLRQVVEAVLNGFDQGTTGSIGGGRWIRIGVLLTAMRTATHSKEIAELAVEYRDRGVVGFDIAGAEAGFPPTRHLGRLRVSAARECALHHPRGRGFRSAVYLGKPSNGAGSDRLGHGGSHRG